MDDRQPGCEQRGGTGVRTETIRAVLLSPLPPSPLPRLRPSPLGGREGRRGERERFVESTKNTIRLVGWLLGSFCEMSRRGAVGCMLRWGREQGDNHSSDGWVVIGRVAPCVFLKLLYLLQGRGAIR